MPPPWGRMGTSNESNDDYDPRREFIQQLREHEDVRKVNFSRDGFQTIIVELASNAEFQDQWSQMADRLGYSVQKVEAEVPLSDQRADVWILQLEEPGDIASQTTWRTKVRSAGAFVRRVIARLLGDNH